jgi:hypothetical protein
MIFLPLRSDAYRIDHVLKPAFELSTSAGADQAWSIFQDF